VHSSTFAKKGAEEESTPKEEEEEDWFSTAAGGKPKTASPVPVTQPKYHSPLEILGSMMF
jgi:hypothetical protein